MDEYKLFIRDFVVAALCEWDREVEVRLNCMTPIQVREALQAAYVRGQNDGREEEKEIAKARTNGETVIVIP